MRRRLSCGMQNILYPRIEMKYMMPGRESGVFSMECSIDELKKEESLMATFRPLLKKVKVSITTRQGADYIYEPPWFVFERMAEFLMPSLEIWSTLSSENATLKPCKREHSVKKEKHSLQVETHQTLPKLVANYPPSHCFCKGLEKGKCLTTRP